MKIQFIRPAPYKYKSNRLSLYDSYNLVAAGSLQPLVDISKIDKLKYSQFTINVVSSPLPRARATAEAFNKDYKAVEELREISYNMSQLLSSNDFEQLGDSATNVARIRFFEALFADELSESLRDVNKRCEQLLKQLQKHNGDTLAISHGFFMKFLETYLINGDATRDYDKFQKHYDGSRVAFNFLEGFKINLNNQGKYKKTNSKTLGYNVKHNYE